MLDAVGVIGPCTVGDLALFLGRSRHSLYYHVRALKECGLLRTAGGSKRRGKVIPTYVTPGRPHIVRFDLRTPRARKAVLALAAARLRSAGRGFVRACREQIAVVEGPRRNLWATRWTGTLTPSALEEANRHFARLIELFKSRRSGAPDEPVFELTFVLAPTVVRRRERKGKPGKRGGAR
jgi:hypothetical protein